MTCKHLLGVCPDYDPIVNMIYEYDDLEGLEPEEIFKFCPKCGINLQCEHVFDAIERADSLVVALYPQCIKCKYTPSLIEVED